MYIYEGKNAQDIAKSKELDIYTVDLDFHRRLVKRWAGRRPTDEWEPNKMFKKRDFQEINPPRTVQEYYSRYKPSVGWGTGIALGSILFLMLLHVIVKWTYKQWKRFKKTKFYAKAFVRHQKQPKTGTIQHRHGEFSSSYPTSASNSAAHHKRNSKRKSLVEIARAAAEARIEVHVIGPTPSVSQKCLTAEEYTPACEYNNNNNNNNNNTTDNAKNSVDTNDTNDNNKSSEACGHSAVVTEATIEMRPLLCPSSRPGQDARLMSYSDGSLPTTLPLVHETKFGKSPGSEMTLNTSRNGNLLTGRLKCD